MLISNYKIELNTQYDPEKAQYQSLIVKKVAHFDPQCLEQQSMIKCFSNAFREIKNNFILSTNDIENLYNILRNTHQFDDNSIDILNDIIYCLKCQIKFHQSRIKMEVIQQILNIFNGFYEKPEHMNLIISSMKFFKYVWDSNYARDTLIQFNFFTVKQY